MDSASTWQSNTWAWTSAYAYLFASNSLPIGSLACRALTPGWSRVRLPTSAQQRRPS